MLVSTDKKMEIMSVNFKTCSKLTYFWCLSAPQEWRTAEATSASFKAETDGEEKERRNIYKSTSLKLLLVGLEWHDTDGSIPLFQRKGVWTNLRQ